MDHSFSKAIYRTKILELPGTEVLGYLPSQAQKPYVKTPYYTNLFNTVFTMQLEAKIQY